MNPYDPILPRLHMGQAPPPHSQWKRAFDVIALCAVEYQPPDVAFRNVKVVRCPIDDDNPTEKECLLAIAAARECARAMRAKKRVLVTCRMGRNRSGLVTVLTLYFLGFTVHDAIARVRKARGPTALSNQYFVRLLHSLSQARERRPLPRAS